MTKRASLTPRQNDIYEFIRTHLRQRGAPPTITEIGQRFGMRSTNGVNDVLNVLERKGYIVRIRGAARGIALADTEPEAQAGGSKGTRRIPVVGEGDSSNPFSIFMNPRGMLAIDTALMPQPNLFAAVVPDDAMDGEGIFKGDYVVVRQSADPPENGALVFGLQESGIVVRRVRITGQGRALAASNKYYKNVPFRDGDASVAVVGVVVGIIRKL